MIDPLIEPAAMLAIVAVAFIAGAAFYEMTFLGNLWYRFEERAKKKLTPEAYERFKQTLEVIAR